MKLGIKGILLILCAIASIIVVGCEKNASDEVFGTPKVFMPQAQIAALRYNVPNTGVGLDSVTKNFQITTDSVKVILGISRSGTESGSSYTADIFVNADTVNQLISTGVFPMATTVMLPPDSYAMPSSVSVPEGSAANTFYLTINRQKLKSYAGKTVLLSVGINNPSKYTLNTAINKVIIVINVTALNL